MRKDIGNKVVVIGAGFVGTATAFTLVESGMVDDLILIDLNKKKAEGEVMDLNHGISFLSPINIKAGDYSDCANADIIIISAGVGIDSDETRLDLANKNSKIIKGIMKSIVEYTRTAIILVATNPPDILTYIAAKSVGYDETKVIGSGTVLDSSRFKYLLSKHCGINPRSIHAYILGEHGDSEVAAWSITNIAGTRVDHLCEMCQTYKTDCTGLPKDEIFDDVKNAAYEIISRKGETSYGIAFALRRIVEAILKNENAVLTISSQLKGEYGIKDVSLSVPTVVNRNGVGKILELPLDEDELKFLQESSEKLKEVINKVSI